MRAEPQILNKKNHLRWGDPIRATFLPSALIRPFHELVNGVFAESNEAMVALEFCVEALSKTRPEGEIIESDLNSLKTDCSALFDEIQMNVGSPELKRFLLELFNSFSDGLNSYQIRGVTGLDDALDVALGRLTKYKRSLNTHTNHDKSLLEKVLKFVKKKVLK